MGCHVYCAGAQKELDGMLATEDGDDEWSRIPVSLLSACPNSAESAKNQSTLADLVDVILHPGSARRLSDMYFRCPATGSVALMLSFGRVCLMIALLAVYFGFGRGCGTSPRIAVAGVFGTTACFDPVYLLSNELGIFCEGGPVLTLPVIVAIVLAAGAIALTLLFIGWQHMSARLDDMCMSDSEDEKDE